jgi:hypothetical protein
MRTSEAVWLAGIPALFFTGIVGILAVQDAELRVALTPQAIDALLSKWLYVAYFSVTSILVYNIYEDYGAEFKSRRFLWYFYIIVFISSANTLIAMLLEEASAWKGGGKTPTATGSMALSYSISVVALFAYSMFREADLALRGTPRPIQANPSIPIAVSGLGAQFASVVPHIKRYWLPALVTTGVTCGLVFGLRADSLIAYFVSTLTMVGSIVFPLFMHFTPRK